MKIQSKRFRIILILLPAITLGLIYFFRQQLFDLGTLFPGCPSYTYLHIYCPGCGNTRSVQHLLSGDLAGSLRYNPVPVFGILLLLLGYVEMLSYSFNRRVRLIPRSKPFWSIIGLVFIIYFVVRNFIRIF
ncbi:hypothetical protein CLHUN_23930 [Ruminiclostridium hungatei]|uniref:DUF2752 domain-containing protein n=1 Tax=Ruminiclostridium hungatei TaxID=48256 RepID=A0A1V4SIS3_RUMHU|nr:DUF2752 domain-containing protein [Ruminiclostridium hungatei]OPX43673.1 hypothetical protein CLHUN_23930 [Ruminiclostridium hungatei]